MAKLVVNSESLTSVADAIRAKGNTTDELEFPNGFVNGINAIESGGGTDTLRALFTNALTEYTIYDEFSLGGVRLSRNKLEKFVAPNLTAIDQFTFYSCGMLKFVDLGKVSTIANVFNGLHRIETVILRKTEAVVSLSQPFSNSNSVNKEDYHIDGVLYYCNFYVPKVLIEDYKVATNWSNYANRFRAIEDYPEITGGVL